MAILADWICRSGIRRTAAGFVHDLSVKAEATAHVDRVEFAIVANGTPHSTLTASARTIRKPNFSDQPSPDPTVGDGQKPFDGWGVGLNLSTVPAGTITVTATVFEVGGASFVIPDTMTIYNDTDGGDRRPRTVGPYFVDGTSGNDANTGLSWAQAVRSPMRALQLGRSAGGEIGGLRINCRGTIVDMAAGISGFDCTTSGNWWCEWVADASGCFLNPPGDPAPLAPRSLHTGQFGASSSAVTCRHRWIGFRWGIDNLVSRSRGGIVEHWVDGGYMQAETYLGPNRVTVRYAYEGADGFFWGWDGFPLVVGRRIFSGVDIRGALGGFQAHSFLWDCRVRDFLGIAARLGSDAPRTTSGGLLMVYERYRPRAVEGFVRMDADPTQGQGRPALTVTKPTGTTARITGPVGGYDFSIDAAALVGQTYWGLRFTGTLGTNLDTSTAHIVTAVGNTGGAPWVEVTAPGAVAGSIPANTASFWTAQATGPVPGREYWYLHPDGYQVERAVSRDIIFDCALVDANDLQSYFTSSVTSYNLDLFLFDNCRDDGSGLSAMNWFGSDCTNSILQRLTISGQLQNSGTSSGWAGSVIRDCVFGTLGGAASTIPSRGGTVDRCHVITGAGFGTNATTGTWFAGTPTVSPFSVAPQVSRYGTGTPQLEPPSVWRYGASGATRGNLRNVAELNWYTLDVGIVGAGPGNVAVAPPVGSMTAGALLSQLSRIPDAPAAAPAGSLVAGVIMAETPSARDPMTVEAPAGNLAAGSAAVVFVGSGPAEIRADGLAGTMTAHALLAGSGANGSDVAAPTGTVLANALLAGAGPAGVDVAAPDGTVVLGVLMDGQPFGSTISATAPAGELQATPSIQGAASGAPIESAPARGRFVVQEIDQPPTANRPTRRERGRDFGRWSSTRPRRRWRF